MGQKSCGNKTNFFDRDYALFWANLSRLNGLLIILNISLFFMTGLVTKGYYYTCYSLIGLGIVAIGLLIPSRLVESIRYYLFFVIIESIAIYFLVASVVYWVRQGAG